MNTQRKLSKSSKAGRRMGKNYAQFVKTKSLSLALLKVFVTHGKNWQQQSYSYYRQCFGFLNNIAPTLFTFALALSILQVSGSYSHEYNNWLRKKVITQTCGQAIGTLDSTLSFLLKL